MFRHIDPQHYEQKIRNLECENEELRAEVGDTLNGHAMMIII